MGGDALDAPALDDSSVFLVLRAPVAGPADDPGLVAVVGRILRVGRV